MADVKNVCALIKSTFILLFSKLGLELAFNLKAWFNATHWIIINNVVICIIIM